MATSGGSNLQVFLWIHADLSAKIVQRVNATETCFFLLSRNETGEFTVRIVGARKH